MAGIELARKRVNKHHHCHDKNYKNPHANAYVTDDFFVSHQSMGWYANQTPIAATVAVNAMVQPSAKIKLSIN
jgi:hypothetical protein